MKSIGGSFRTLALMAARGHVFGAGPTEFPVTNAARSAEITQATTGANWRLTIFGAQTMLFTHRRNWLVITAVLFLGSGFIPAGHGMRGRLRPARWEGSAGSSHQRRRF